MISPTNSRPSTIKIFGAKVHNLKNISLEIPLHQFVGIAGVSGSGKSSLALGVLYAEGSRRYLDALSAYTRRRLTQAEQAKVERIEDVPAALALHQRPMPPDIRSTFGTQTELLNYIRLLFSRLGSHICPNGHRLEPSANVALDKKLVCTTCQTEFFGPSAEELAFNSDGACPKCQGTGTIRTIKTNALIPDETLTLRQGAVAAWNQFGTAWMFWAAAELGVRIDVPYKDLSEREKEIIDNPTWYSCWTDIEKNS